MIPASVQSIHVRKRKHISQLRQIRPDKRISKEDLPTPGSLEELTLSMVKHPHLAHMVKQTRTLISPQLKDSLPVLSGSRRNNQLRPSLERPQQRALNPLKGRLLR